MFAWIGYVTVAGTAVGAILGLALLLFRKFGEGWLQNTFAKDLEQFRHEQSRELERLRGEINASLDRAVKLAQREFEVLPRLWSSFNEAFHRTLAVSSSFQSYPNLDAMTPERLEEFLSECRLRPWQINEVRNAAKKNDLYAEYERLVDINDAFEARRKASIAMLEHGIFLQQAMLEDFKTIDHVIHAALTSLFEAHQQRRLRSSLPHDVRTLKELGPELFEALQRKVRERLCSFEESDSAWMPLEVPEDYFAPEERAVWEADRQRRRDMFPKKA